MKTCFGEIVQCCSKVRVDLDLAIPPLVLLLCVSGLDLCASYGVSAEALVDTWISFTVSFLKGADPSPETLALMERRELRHAGSSGVATPSGLVIYSQEDDDPYPCLRLNRRDVTGQVPVAAPARWRREPVASVGLASPPARGRNEREGREGDKKTTTARFSWKTSCVASDGKIRCKKGGCGAGRHLG